MKRFTLGKKERLKSRKQIDLLFTRGKSLAVYPVRVSYQFVAADEASILQAGFTASKKNFKRAVDRNRIKRLLREAYRLQKEPLQRALEGSGKKGSLFFIYTDKIIHPFPAIQTAMGKCLQQLEKKAAFNEDPA